MTVCVPAFHAEDFITETLASVQSQSHGRLRVLVSIDVSTDATEEACREFERDRRFEVFVQDRRLGWVENINFLLDRVETELFFLMPHDDLLDRDYVRELRQSALRAPEAVVAYSDLVQEATVTRVLSTPGLDGPLPARVAALLTRPGAEGVPFRGLTRSSALRRGLRMRNNAFDGYGAHVLWVLELLCMGPFCHVPSVLYRRIGRREQTSVVEGWMSRPEDERLAAWIEHSTACLRLLARAGSTSEERVRLVVAQLARTLGGYRRSTRITEPKEAARDTRQAITGALLTGALGDGVGVGADALRRVRDDEELWEAVDRLPVG